VEEDRPRPPLQTADRILLTVLLVMNAAVLVGVPAAGVRVWMILRRVPPGRFPAWFPPALFAALVLFEALLVWRFRSILRRLRAGSGRGSSVSRG